MDITDMTVKAFTTDKPERAACAPAGPSRGLGRPLFRGASGAGLALASALLAALFLAGCPAPGKTGGREIAPVPPPEKGSPPVAGRPLSGVPAPWGDLAGSLSRLGLPEDRVRGFFRSEGLAFTPRPMETKLRELFGIFFRSDLTKQIQESLYQLGYDIRIDGRNGSGTRAAIQRYQKDHGLAADGRVTQALAKALDAAARSGKVRPLSEYRPPPAGKPDRTSTHTQFSSPSAVASLRAHYQADKAIFDRMERAYQVPGPLVASIMWIETGYGSYFGKAKAAVSLASMAASADYSLIAPRLSDIDRDSETRAYLSETAAKRGAWARDELAALLSFAWANGHDPMEFPGSIYGAVGYGQFMPSNISRYAVDGDGDQRIDLFEKTDAVFSIGNYLKEHGWSGDMSSEDKRRAVIRKYNNSGTYINTVLYVAGAL
ncbi:MAG: lytic murein transglycosylase [Deltaproteobacteria bacterium]|nr:lytic murein transglycosylase [Deltaproteobacteria bacterium]